LWTADDRSLPRFNWRGFCPGLRLVAGLAWEDDERGGEAKMAPSNNGRGPLEDSRIPIKVRLSALWAATMFLYVYGDYFGLYQPAQLRDMLAGQMGPLGPASQGVLLAVSAMMAIPSIMVFLTLALPARAARPANIALGAIYTLIVLATMPGSWAFYQFLSALEMVLTLGVVWLAWRWPRAAAPSRAG
jgi:hypothetical protein